jgi:ribosome biogenesis GTPase A
VSVKPEDYINIISSIKDDTALMVIMVDLLDFPCSIFPNLADIVGKTRPIFIVGNKIDVIPRDKPNYLEHIKECLAKEALKMGFEKNSIRNVSLISAKTGYGIEELITKLQSVWKYQGNVYLIGCTNVGKSSLFNALIKSDYCKSEASNLIQRATTCAWPGTTLKLLKFPILRPSDYRIYLRTQRLINQQKQLQPIEALRRQRAQSQDSITDATLIGHIGRTFDDKEVLPDPVAQNQQSGFSKTLEVFEENKEKYKLSKWCFDTPGVMHGDQVLPYLTTDEILKVLPREMIRPRMYYAKSGMSLFLGGLARLDVIDVPRNSRLIVYSSLKLPISICDIDDADEFYESFLGSEILGVPIDMSDARLSKWPKLEAAYEEIVIDGTDKYETVCDLVMSSVGWIGVNLPNSSSGVFRPWILGKQGFGVRNPSILPSGWALRGDRVRDSPAYTIGKAYTFKKAFKLFKKN